MTTDPVALYRREREKRQRGMEAGEYARTMREAEAMFAAATQAKPKGGRPTSLTGTGIIRLTRRSINTPTGRQERPQVHGTRYAYEARKCRCPVCAAWHVAAKAQQAEARRARYGKGATVRPYQRGRAA